MGVPISQMWTVASYVLKMKLRGVKRYPLVLMLEPLFRCNLECAGCGKIQYPTEILKKQLTPEARIIRGILDHTLALFNFFTLLPLNSAMMDDPSSKIFAPHKEIDRL